MTSIQRIPEAQLFITCIDTGSPQEGQIKSKVEHTERQADQTCMRFLHILYIYTKKQILEMLLTPYACALVGYVVLQFGSETRLSSSAAHTAVVH